MFTLEICKEARKKMDLAASSRMYKGSTYTSARISPSAASAKTLKISRVIKNEAMWHHFAGAKGRYK